MEQRTHDYTCRYDFEFIPIDGGLRGMLQGWGHGLRANDYLILPNGAATTRYLIEQIAYYADPPDRWEAKVRFAPRNVRRK